MFYGIYKQHLGHYEIPKWVFVSEFVAFHYSVSAIHARGSRVGGI